MSYDYKQGKVRVTGFLRRRNRIIKTPKIPTDSSFTFENAYRAYVTAIFVDIRDSTTLFTEHDELKVSKVVRAFTSETIEILKKSNNLREIGIRGDCVYAIYTTPKNEDDSDIYFKSAYVNTFIKMLKKLLNNYQLPDIAVGIGVATAKELVVKAGRKSFGINNKVWIGKAVTTAANLSSLANKDGYKQMLFSEFFYNSIIGGLTSRKGDSALTWFTEYSNDELGVFYGANIIMTEFDDWIKGGMK